MEAGRKAQAQEAKAPYPNMAPLDQYLMEGNAGIALARSAAPASVSQNAEVMILGRHGYEAGQRQERFRVRRRTIMDRWHGRSRFLESQTVGPDLLQPACCAIPTSTDHQENRVDIGRTI